MSHPAQEFHVFLKIHWKEPKARGGLRAVIWQESEQYLHAWHRGRHRWGGPSHPLSGAYTDQGWGNGGGIETDPTE